MFNIWINDLYVITFNIFSVLNDTSLDTINVFSTRKPIENITVCLKHNKLSIFDKYHKSYLTNIYLRPIK